MRIRRMLLLCAAALAAAATLGAEPAAGRGALGYDQDQCVLKIGPDFLYFSGYQNAAAHRKFCEDAPAVGETTFVFDYGQDELRQMKADFRILRDSGDEQASAADGESLAYLPPRVYPSGTFSFVYRFNEPGDYRGIVSIEGQDGEKWIASFPFSVGGPPPSTMPYILLAVAAALAVLVFLFGGDKKKPAR
jgi:hypothetical protein